ncbi:MAG: replicative DNA helicase [Acidimicrobiia bacterium]
MSQPERSGGTMARIPPHNLAAEESLLGAMLLSRDAIATAVEAVTADAFYKPAHAHIFDAITNLYGAGEPADPITVAEELRRAGLLDAMGGSALLVDLQAATPSIGNAARYAKIVEENALLRKLIGVAGEIAEMGYEMPDDVTKAVDRAESMIFEVAQRRVADTTVALRDLLGDALDRLEKLFERGESITGLPTGYADLDELLSGLQPSALIVIGARPSMGKCVAADTLILDPATGLRSTVAALYERGVAADYVQVPALDRSGRVCVAEPSAFVDDGVKPLFRVRTASGRTVRTTSTHPFLTKKGWTPLSELRCGIEIAVPRSLPFFGDARLPGGEVVLLAHLLVAGRVPIGDLLEKGRDLDVDPVAVVAKYGLADIEPNEVAFPPSVFALQRDLLARLVDRVLDGLRPRWSDDGAALSYVVVSSRLAYDIQHALLRFGIDADVVPDDAARPCVVKLSEQARRSIATHAAVGIGVSAGSSDAMLASTVVDDDGTDVSWDPIVEITYVGDEQVYDLTVPELHNFVADDVFVHNTAFALGMAAHAAVREERPVLFFSLEMGHRELTQRILSSEARVDSSRMRKGDLREDDWSKLMKAIGSVEQAQLWIDDNPNVSVMEIRAKARRMKSRLGDLGLIVIDYLQLMTGRSSAESRQVEVSEISRNLKILARELEVPVIALSQLSRALELRADKRPMLADLRESGSIEQDADVVMFIYRDEVYNAESPDKGIAEIIVAKHRNGATGTKRLAFIGNYTRFANMARGS